jgi:hypothetical protein
VDEMLNPNSVRLCGKISCRLHVHRLKRMASILDIQADSVHDTSRTGHCSCHRALVFDIRAEWFDLPAVLLE